MHELDFLPAAYRQQQTRRAWFSQRLLVVALFVGLLAAAAGGQFYRRAQVQAALAALAPQCDQAQRLSVQLATLQTELHAAETGAELQTYLRHPWPRSRLLAALAEALPNEIRFHEIRIGHETPPGGEVAERTPRPSAAAQEQQQAKLTPAERDLAWLRETYDRGQTTIRLMGRSAEIASLYQYLEKLARNDLFVKADLLSLTQQAEGGAQFQALVTVRPGYGQPNGPTQEAKPAVPARVALTTASKTAGATP